VLEVIETVKRVFGIDFEVAFVGRRAGDPARIVAAFNRARALLKWQPDFDNLQTIVCLTGMGAQVFDAPLDRFDLVEALTDRQRVDFTDIWPG